MESPTQAATRVANDFKEQGFRVAALVAAIKEEVRARPLPEHDEFLDQLSRQLRGTSGRAAGEDAGDGGDGGGPAVVLSESICKRLGARDQLEADPRQASYLLNRSLSFVLTLDQLVWTVWKNIAPTSRHKRQTGKVLSLPSMIRDTLSGTRSHREEDMTAVFEKTRQLAAGLIGAIGPMGRTFGRRQAAKFSPQGIQDMVRREGTRAGFMGGEEVKCWKKYNDLFEDLQEDVIEQDLHQAIVKYTEDLLRSSKV